LLAGMMEMRAHSRTGGELASAELGARYPVDAAIPRTEIAVGEHAVGKFAAQLQQARSLRRPRHGPARPARLPARRGYRCEAVKLDPQRGLAACCRIKLHGDRRGDAELGWAPVLGNVQVPCERASDRWIVPNSQLGQVAHEPTPLALSIPWRRRRPRRPHSDLDGAHPALMSFPAALGGVSGCVTVAWASPT